MKKTLFFYSKIIAGLLVLLGFTTSCDKRVEYGTPNADYVVKGKVIDKNTRQPIKNILVSFWEEPRIVPMYGVIPTPYQQKPSTYTDENGNYVLRWDGVLPNAFDDMDSIAIQDIDGIENGGFFNWEVMGVDFSTAQQTKPTNQWYQGEFTITKDIELTKDEESK
jgi:putative lipoprotein (rSAM/lipoprotein system)